MQNPLTSWNSIDLEKLKANDQSEITRLYNTLKPYFIKHLQNNEELFNDFVLRILNTIHDFKAQAKFSTWVFCIANNMLLNHLSKEKCRKKKERLINEAYILMQEQHFSVENKEQLELILAELKPKQQVFIEKYLENKPLYTEQRHKFCYAVKRLKQIHCEKFSD